MKFLPLTLAVLNAALCLAADAQSPPSGSSGQGIQFLPEKRLAPTRRATTNPELKARLEKEKFEGFRKEPGQVTHWDILEHSDFLAYDGCYTLLPKGAVLFLPDRLASCKVAGPQGQLVLWRDFSAKYRALIEPCEVSLEEATGKKIIDPTRWETLQKTDRIVVAVLNRSPISVASSALPASPSSAP
ncbi:hypothetical protein HNR46_002551 [Haloferula luteola]|uniref:Uncharacterized protein n=1 Tax=Haloferula luteola TaxID=595692 RepID=A0A840VCC0_9BACT|nr:hypothetical protein [Haloferula luteola]MBB5352308.1 hypothetical protein [Haloferula luteola]